MPLVATTSNPQPQASHSRFPSTETDLTLTPSLTTTFSPITPPELPGITSKRSTPPSAVMETPMTTPLNPFDTPPRAPGVRGVRRPTMSISYSHTPERTPSSPAVGPRTAVGRTPSGPVGGNRVARWLIIVTPSKEMEQGIVDSGGIFLPLQPTLTSQIISTLHPYAFDSPIGLTLHLFLPPNLSPSDHSMPRLTEDTWPLLFAPYLSTTPDTYPSLPEGLPIVARVQVRVDGRARWFEEWRRKAGEGRLGEPVMPRGVSAPFGFGGVARREVGERGEMGVRVVIPGGSGAVVRAAEETVTGGSGTVLGSAIQLTSHTPATSTPRPPPAVNTPIINPTRTRNLDDRVRSWRDSGTPFNPPLLPLVLHAEPSPARSRVRSIEKSDLVSLATHDMKIATTTDATPVESPFSLSDFQWSISSLGPHSPTSTKTDGSFHHHLPYGSPDIGRRVEGSVVPSLPTATSWGPPSTFPASPSSDYDRHLPSPDMAWRIAGSVPASPASGTSWGPGSPVVGWEEVMNPERRESVDLGERAESPGDGGRGEGRRVPGWWVGKEEGGKEVWDMGWPYYVPGATKEEREKGQPWGMVWPYREIEQREKGKPWAMVWPYRTEGEEVEKRGEGPWSLVWPYNEEKAKEARKSEKKVDAEPWPQVWPYNQAKISPSRDCPPPRSHKLAKINTSMKEPSPPTSFRALDSATSPPTSGGRPPSFSERPMAGRRRSGPPTPVLIPPPKRPDVQVLVPRETKRVEPQRAVTEPAQLPRIALSDDRPQEPPVSVGLATSATSGCSSRNSVAKILDKQAQMIRSVSMVDKKRGSNVNPDDDDRVELVRNASMSAAYSRLPTSLPSLATDEESSRDSMKGSISSSKYGGPIEHKRGDSEARYSKPVDVPRRPLKKALAVAANYSGDVELSPPLNIPQQSTKVDSLLFSLQDADGSGSDLFPYDFVGPETRIYNHNYPRTFRPLHSHADLEYVVSQMRPGEVIQTNFAVLSLSARSQPRPRSMESEQDDDNIPGIKCSGCGSNVSLLDLGSHVCLTPPVPVLAKEAPRPSLAPMSNREEIPIRLVQYRYPDIKLYPKVKKPIDIRLVAFRYPLVQIYPKHVRVKLVEYSYPQLVICGKDEGPKTVQVTLSPFRYPDIRLYPKRQPTLLCPYRYPSIVIYPAVKAPLRITLCAIRYPNIVIYPAKKASLVPVNVLLQPFIYPVIDIYPSRRQVQPVKIFLVKEPYPSLTIYPRAKKEVTPIRVLLCPIEYPSMRVYPSRPRPLRIVLCPVQYPKMIIYPSRPKALKIVLCPTQYPTMLIYPTPPRPVQILLCPLHYPVMHIYPVWASSFKAVFDSYRPLKSKERPNLKAVKISLKTFKYPMIDLYPAPPQPVKVLLQPFRYPAITLYPVPSTPAKVLLRSFRYPAIVLYPVPPRPIRILLRSTSYPDLMIYPVPPAPVPILLRPMTYPNLIIYPAKPKPIYVHLPAYRYPDIQLYAPARPSLRSYLPRRSMIPTRPPLYTVPCAPLPPLPPIAGSPTRPSGSSTRPFPKSRSTSIPNAPKPPSQSLPAHPGVNRSVSAVGRVKPPAWMTEENKEEGVRRSFVPPPRRSIQFPKGGNPFAAALKPS